MARTLKAGLVVVAAAAAGACAATTFTSTWKAPDAAPLNFKGRKVVALVINPEQSLRYGSEDAVARELTARGAVGVQAYSLIPKELTQDREKAKEILVKAGAAGVVVSRVVGRDKDFAVRPSSFWTAPHYTSFWAGGGSFGWAWGGVTDPSYLRTETTVSVETLVYSLDQDKLVWAGHSETTSPKQVGPFIKELAAQVAARLKQEGLIR